MTELLTLTACFAERERAAGRFLAEAMLELFDRHEVATSVMLRGIASFGPTHVVRSDRMLSLSEDPPVTITAVDTRDRILALTDAVAAMTARGVLTLGHASTLPRDTGDVRITVYLGRRQRIAGTPGYVAVCAVLHRLGFAGAEVFLGVDGTVGGQRRRARFFSRNADVPVLISGVGSGGQARAAVDELRATLPTALMTVAPVRVCKRDGATLAEPGRAPLQRLTVRTSEDARHNGAPVHRALVDRLKDSDTSGATVLRGVWGFHGAQPPHGDRFLQWARHVPVATVIVDSAPHIAACMPLVDELTAEGGLVTCEAVPAVLARHAGQSLGTLRLD